MRKFFKRLFIILLLFGAISTAIAVVLNVA